MDELKVNIMKSRFIYYIKNLLVLLDEALSNIVLKAKLGGAGGNTETAPLEQTCFSVNNTV